MKASKHQINKVLEEATGNDLELAEALVHEHLTHAGNKLLVRMVEDIELPRI